MDKNQKGDTQYEDIIQLPHHVSQNHPQMSMHDRAAQFSPFAALTGYDGAIKETARLTEQRIELDETQKEELNEKLRIIQENPGWGIIVEITYFQPDLKKEGGSYITAYGTVKKMNGYERTVVMEDGKVIPMDEIVDITMG